MAVPGLNGFVGEMLILLGTFEVNPWWAGVGVLGVIFGALYTLTLLKKTLFGPVTASENRSLRDLAWGQTVPLLILALFMLWIGLAPGFLINKMKPTLENYWKKPQSAYAMSGKAK